MADEERITPEELKEEIWDTFEEDLRSFGVTGVDSFELYIDEKPPSAQEVGKKLCWMKRLGRIGKFFIWAFWCAGGLLQLFSTVANLPDDWARFKVNYPTSYEVVSDMADRFRRDEIVVAPGKSVEVIYTDRYIIYDPKWENNRALFEEDQAWLRQGRNINEEGRKLVFLPSSTTATEVVLASSSAHDYST